MKNDKINYVITPKGVKELNLPENTLIKLHPKTPINFDHWERATLFEVIEEKLDFLPSDKRIKRDTRWIFLETNNPTITGVFGGYINSGCHILPSYETNFLNNLLNKQLNEK